MCPANYRQHYGDDQRETLLGHKKLVSPPENAYVNIARYFGSRPNSPRLVGSEVLTDRGQDGGLETMPLGSEAARCVTVNQRSAIKETDECCNENCRHQIKCERCHREQ
ncbi:hypothetical protein NDU88_010616 [Pleurodeles waltl]|uniref:Uncharacterized protein n=1 Tax=Pleurodeles waltl TaxID=8319 RepID=A0AAV7RYR2_PLEWA|nr:hypothetical protein NDU88_010616 [Pleurodeles waltl]